MGGLMGERRGQPPCPRTGLDAILAVRQMRRTLLLAPILASFLPGCALHRPLERPAWSHARAGSMGALARAGVWNDHDAQSRVRFQSNFGDEDIALGAQLEGELGLALAGELFLSSSWSFLFGVDYRLFQPTETPGFLFDTVESTEFFLGARWLAPMTFGTEDRWRPFLGVKVAGIPRTVFDAEVDLSEIDQPNPDYEFEGDPYFNLGLSAGLAYQLSDHAVLQFSVMHEWPLGSTEDTVNLEFLPGFEVDLDTTIEPEGTMAFVGISWYL